MCRLLLYVLVVISALTVAFPHPHFIQQRSGSGRSSRGFQIQNGKLSTARGFGKRGGIVVGLDNLRLPASFDPISLKYPTAFDMEPNLHSSWPLDETVRDLKEKGEESDNDLDEGREEPMSSIGYNFSI